MASALRGDRRAGLLKPDAGQVILDGKPVVSPRPTVGMAFQNPVLLEWRSILRNVLLPLEIVRGHGLSRREAEDRAAGLLDACGGELQHLISDAATMQVFP